MIRERAQRYNCPVEATIDIVGGKYKAIIIYHLIDATLRFSELQKEIPQATAKMLSQQLKELEADGIINRVLYPVVPPKTEYSLTDLGKTLIPIIQSLCDWGDNYLKLLDVPAACEKEEA